MKLKTVGTRTIVPSSGMVSLWRGLWGADIERVKCTCMDSGLSLQGLSGPPVPPAAGHLGVLSLISLNHMSREILFSLVSSACCSSTHFLQWGGDSGLHNKHKTGGKSCRAFTLLHKR